MVTLLHGYTNNDTIVVGTPMTSRFSVESESTIGFLAQLSLIVVDMSGNPSFEQLIGRVVKAIKEREKNFIPYNEMINILQEERADAHFHPIQVVLNYFSYTKEMLVVDKLEFEPIDLIRSGLGFDYFITIMSHDAEDIMRVEYAADLFTSNAIEEFIEDYRLVLRKVVTDAQLRIKSFFDRSLERFGPPKTMTITDTINYWVGNHMRIRIASNFSAEPINVKLLEINRDQNLDIEVNFSPLNTVFGDLFAKQEPADAIGDGQNVLFIRLEDWAATSSFFTNNGNIGDIDLRGKTDEFLDQLANRAPQCSVPTIVCLCPSSPIQLAKPLWREKVLSCEEHFVDSLTAIDKVKFVHYKEILSEFSIQQYYDADLDKLGRIPYTNAFFDALAVTLLRRIVTSAQQGPDIDSMAGGSTIKKAVHINNLIANDGATEAVASTVLDTQEQQQTTHSDTEEQMVKIWMRLLDLDNIKRSDDFFDIGGNSLKLTRMLFEIRKQFNLVISQDIAFKAPTIAKIAKLIDEQLTYV